MWRKRTKLVTKMVLYKTRYMRRLIVLVGKGAILHLNALNYFLSNMSSSNTLVNNEFNLICKTFKV